MKNLLLASVTTLAFLYMPSASAGSITIPGVTGTFTVKTQSFAEARFHSVVRQQYDFSCGSAAVATLLTHHYQQPVDEQDVFDAMYEKGDKEKIHEQGFSLLDMKNYLESRGLRADGFRISLDKLLSVGVPAIALINTDNYLHFVVVKGVNNNEVLMGDPSLGLKTTSREEFESMWNGILFLIKNKADVARGRFNAYADWRVPAKSPNGVAMSRAALSSFTLSLPRRSEF